MLERLSQQKPGLLLRKQRHFERPGAHKVRGPGCMQQYGDVVTTGTGVLCVHASPGRVGADPGLICTRAKIQLHFAIAYYRTNWHYSVAETIADKALGL